MAPITLHLRSEDKSLEHRSACKSKPPATTNGHLLTFANTLTPSTARQLIENGFKINVESSRERIFDDKEFVDVPGVTMVPTGSWPNAESDHLILGLKELAAKDFPLKHTHIQFAHCYKSQSGWQSVLQRFVNGGGMLYDLEYLEDQKRRRVAAFGESAGYCGAALAIMDWAWQLEHEGDSNKPLPAKTPYQNETHLIKEVKAELEKGLAKTNGEHPRVLVIGALGRCGRGALNLCRAVGIPEDRLLQWDLDQTRPGGPFLAIRESDIFINCIYRSADVPKFITKEFLHEGKRRLSVVCDVSCDTTNSKNPIPFCDQPTYFNSPTIQLHEFSRPPLSYITIDHLPSLLPREASEKFSEALLPSLLELKNRSTNPVWLSAEELFKEKVKEMEKTKEHA